MLLFIVIDLIIICCCILREIRIKKIKKFINIIILLIFFSMSGLAYKIHSDFFVYQLIYPEMNFKNFMSTANFEYGYTLICLENWVCISFLNAFFNKFLYFYKFKALVYLVNLTLIYKGLKKVIDGDKIFYVIMFLYLRMDVLSFYMTAFRQSLSVRTTTKSMCFVILLLVNSKKI